MITVSTLPTLSLRAIGGLTRQTILFLSSGCLACLILLNIWQNLDIVSKIYLEQAQTEKLNELQRENNQLTARALGENSFVKLDQLIAKLGMEKVEKVRFIYPTTGSVVTRQSP